MTAPRKVSRISGSVPSAKEYLAEVRRHNLDVMQRARARYGVGLGAESIGMLFQINESKAFRWKVRLACGCVTGVLTYDADAARLASVTRGCFSLNHRRLYRVVSWGNRRDVSADEDEVRRRKLWGDDMPECLARVPARAQADWTAALECGHTREVETDPEFDPDTGPRFADPERLQKLQTIAEYREDVKWVRWIDQGGPEPQQEHECHVCRAEQRVTEYVPLGPLIPPKPAAAAPSPSSAKQRAAVTRRLRDAERAASELRAELERLAIDDA